MRFLLSILLLTGLCAALQPPAASLAQATRFAATIPPSEIHNREILVDFASSASDKSASAALNSANVRTVSALPLSYAPNLQVVRVPDGQDYMATLRQLEADPRVRMVGPNVIKRATRLKGVSAFIPSDPRLLNGAATIEGALSLPNVRDAQWGLLQTGAPEAWETTTGVPSVVVAVIDTGVNFNHEDMQGRWWLNAGEVADNDVDDDDNGFVDDARGYDFFTYNNGSGGDSDPSDPSGQSLSHGHACSSIIAARMDNGIGMTGVAGGDTATGGARIMALRVGTESNIPVAAEIAAIDYAIENGADIISMSFGGETGGPIEEEAIDRAWNAGLVVIAAGGNEGAGNGDFIDLPAGFDNCIAVGATTIFDSQTVGSSTGLIAEERAGYSKVGPELDLAAPGTHIVSALNSANGYTMQRPAADQFTGTSAATPVVAGLAALIKSANSGLTNSQIRDLMEDTAIDLGAPGHDDEFGWGRIDMAAALPEPLGQGDYNGDGIANELDMDEVAERYGARSGDGNYSANVDGNDDGVIDELDIFVIGRNFGT